MVPQIAKELPKTSERLPVSLPVENPETQNNMDFRVIMDITLELKKTVFHLSQILGHNWGAGKPAIKITEEGMIGDTYGEEK